jgi:sterol desaturase/sphingolipid hydroxylase (fatty acid hydroxylase superfamily)
METYGKLLNITVPFFIFFFLIEKVIEWKKGLHVIRGLDSVSSFSSGITNVVKDVLGIGVTIISYNWLVTRIAIFHVEATVLTYLIAFIVIDFQGYWVHRWCHKINFFWNYHIIHHSSEEFNLSCALRQSISNFINFFTFLLIPAALLGVPGKVIAIVAPLHLFLQYWYHTQLIGKMGFLEQIIVTPSHHRVHHAINKEYMDKNLGQIFIFWDKLFGTFQEELDDVKPVYGVTRPVRTWNPVKINFIHLWLLIKDAWQTKNWWDKMRIWFMPTGWRPEDVKEKYPVYYIDDVYHYNKFDTPASKTFIAWSWAQMFFNYFLLVYFFAFIAQIGTPHIFYYGGFVFISIYAYTELMDRNRNALYMEIIKSAFGFYIIYYYGDWFYSSQHWPWYHYIVAAYLFASVFIVGYFSLYQFKKGTVNNSGISIA